MQMAGCPAPDFLHLLFTPLCPPDPKDPADSHLPSAIKSAVHSPLSDSYEPAKPACFAAASSPVPASSAAAPCLPPFKEEAFSDSVLPSLHSARRREQRISTTYIQCCKCQKRRAVPM